jgi:hypothetical protein
MVRLGNSFAAFPECQTAADARDNRQATTLNQLHSVDKCAAWLLVRFIALLGLAPQSAEWMVGRRDKRVPLISHPTRPWPSGNSSRHFDFFGTRVAFLRRFEPAEPLQSFTSNPTGAGRSTAMTSDQPQYEQLRMVSLGLSAATCRSMRATWRLLHDGQVATPSA